MEKGFEQRSMASLLDKSIEQAKSCMKEDGKIFQGSDDVELRAQLAGNIRSAQKFIEVLSILRTMILQGLYNEQSLVNALDFAFS